jgi:hypothetical protein
MGIFDNCRCRFGLFSFYIDSSKYTFIKSERLVDNYNLFILLKAGQLVDELSILWVLMLALNILFPEKYFPNACIKHP